MIEFSPRQALGLLDSPIVLLTSSSDDRHDVMAANMVMGVSMSPILIAVAVSPTSFSHHLIEESGEFALNIAGSDQLDLVEKIGSSSGSEVDKFKEFAIATVPAERIEAPLIQGCPASIECRVLKNYPSGDHNLFVAHVVAIHRSEGEPIFLYRGDYYSPGNKIGHFFKGVA